MEFFGKIEGSHQSVERGQGRVDHVPEDTARWFTVLTGPHSVVYQRKGLSFEPGQIYLGTQKFVEFLKTATSSPWGKRRDQPEDLVIDWAVVIPTEMVAKAKAEAVRHAKAPEAQRDEGPADIAKFKASKVHTFPADLPEPDWPKALLGAYASALVPPYEPADWQLFAVRTSEESMCTQLLKHIEKHNIEVFPKTAPKRG